MPVARGQFGLELGVSLPQPIAKGEMIHGRGAPLLHTVQVLGERRALPEKAPVDVYSLDRFFPVMRIRITASTV